MDHYVFAQFGLPPVPAFTTRSGPRADLPAELVTELTAEVMNAQAA
jgi:hypothetical protein